MAHDLHPIALKNWEDLDNTTYYMCPCCARMMRDEADMVQHITSWHLPKPVKASLQAYFMENLLKVLKGYYCDPGVIAWFGRRTYFLDGKSPSYLLNVEWDPGNNASDSILMLAEIDADWYNIAVLETLEGV